MLIDETTLNALPLLYAQESVEDPTIYAKIATQDGTWACYIAEAEKKEGDYTIFGLFVSTKWGHNWAQAPLHEVEEDLKRARLNAGQVKEFQQATVSSLTGLRRSEHS